MFFPCDEAFRKSAQKINRVLWREEEDEVRYRTVANLVEREGNLIQAHLAKKAEDILIRQGFNAEGQLVDETKVGLGRAKEECLAEDLVSQMIEELNTGKDEELQIHLAELHETFENPLSVKANISLDDVCCKKQKAEGRKKGSPSKEKNEWVKNSVAHIQSGKKETYLLNASSLAQLMTLVLAFLLNNGLLSRCGQLVFFIDGAAELRGAIEHLFGFLPHKIILDWFHLEKKCKERLSLAMKGKQVREQALEPLLAFLWRGKIDLAVTYLRGLNPKALKNPEEIERLIGYFERNRSFLPCYALRQKLGLRVSSNPVEKANDLLVSERQKHNGMSWSASGSASLATVTCVHHNSEHMSWLVKRNIPFQFHTDVENVAA